MASCRARNARRIYRPAALSSSRFTSSGHQRHVAREAAPGEPGDERGCDDARKVDGAPPERLPQVGIWGINPIPATIPPTTTPVPAIENTIAMPITPYGITTQTEWIALAPRLTSSAAER